MTQPVIPLYTPEGVQQAVASSDDAMAAIRAGKAGAAAGTMVPVVLADGSAWKVPAEELGQLPPGARIQTTDEARADATRAAEAELAQLREKREGTALGGYEKAVNAAQSVMGLGLAPIMGGPVGVLAGPGGVRSALASLSGTDAGAAYAQGREDSYTLGLGKLARKSALEALYGKQAAEEYVREKGLERELSPNAYTQGAFEGGVESSIGASGAMAGKGLVRMLGGAQMAPEVAGALAEAGLQRAGMTVGQTMAGHALRGAVTLGVRGGVEGAIAGGASELTEEMFGDPEISGEKVFMAAGKGALAGLALGTLTGAVAPYVARGLEKAGRKADLAVTKAELSMRTKAIPEADEQAFKALSPHAKKSFVEKAEARIEGGTEALGNYVRRVGIEPGSTLGAKGNAPEQILERIETQMTKDGSRIGEIYRTSGARITAEDISKAANKVLHEAPEGQIPLSKQLLRGSSARKVEEALGDLLVKTDLVDANGKVIAGKAIGAEELWQQKTALAKAIYEEHGALEAKGPISALRQFERELDDVLIKRVGDAGADVRELKWLKSEYQKGALASDIAQDGIVKNLKNRNFGMSEMLSATGTLAATGDPLTALAAAGVHRQVRDRGNAVAAVVLGKIGDMQKIDYLTRRVAMLTEQAADGASGTARTPYRGGAANDNASIGKRFDEAAAHVRALSTQNVDLVTQITGAPRISSAFAGAVTRAVAELQARLPPEPPQTVYTHRQRPPTEQMAAFLSSYEALTDPEATLRQVAAGSLDPAKTRALEKVAPSTFADLRDSIEAKAIARIEKGDIPSQAEMTKLHLAFGITLDPTLTPQALFSQQAVMADGSNGEAAQAPSNASAGRKGRASSMKAQRTPSGADRFEK